MAYKPIFALAIALLATSAVSAQNSDAEALCKSNDTLFETRLTACNSLIDSGAYSDQAWVLERRGDAYEDAEQYRLAVQDFHASLNIDNDFDLAYRGLVIANYELGELDAALAASTQLILSRTDSYFDFYWHARVLAARGEIEAARRAFDESLRRKDSYFTWRDLGNMLMSQSADGEAIAAYEAARDIRPFSTTPYRNLGRLYARHEQPALADRNYRIAVMLNPNLGGSGANQRADAAPTLAPLSYATPAPGLQVQYLQVIVPRDTRSEMELAIQDLASWFSPEPKATPIASAFITRTMTTTGDTVTMAMRVDDQENMDRFLAPGARLPDSVEAFRGLFLNEFRPRGMDGPVFRVAYDGPDPAGLWPLKVGNQINGTGRLLLKCPDGFQLESMVLGCRIGMQNLELGTLQYNLIVEKTETAIVPMGQYQTFVVRYRELGTINMGGNVDSRETEIRWWVSPDLDFWVKRTRLQGTNIATAVAVQQFEN